MCSQCVPASFILLPEAPLSSIFIGKALIRLRNEYIEARDAD